MRDVRQVRLPARRLAHARCTGRTGVARYDRTSRIENAVTRSVVNDYGVQNPSQGQPGAQREVQGQQGCSRKQSAARAAQSGRAAQSRGGLPISACGRRAQACAVLSTVKMDFLSANTEEPKNIILALHSSRSRYPPRRTRSRDPQHTHPPPCHPGRVAAQPWRLPRHHLPTTRPDPAPGPGPGPGPGPPQRWNRGAGGVLGSRWDRAEITPMARRDRAEIAPRLGRDCAES